MSYDSTQDTLDHINHVRCLLQDMATKLLERGHGHDASKLVEPEKSLFDEMTPRLKALTYGSDDYKAALKELGVALDHHYATNRHHPEHWPNGVNDMTLIDLIEMFCDWKAATLRHADGDISQSIEINKKRFVISDQLTQLFCNTARELGWTQ